MDRRAAAGEERATRLAASKVPAGTTRGEVGTDGVTEATAAVATVVVVATARGTRETPGEDMVGTEATKVVATGSKTATEVAKVATEVAAATTREKDAVVEGEVATEGEGGEAGEEGGSTTDDHATLLINQNNGREGSQLLHYRRLYGVWEQFSDGGVDAKSNKKKITCKPCGLSTYRVQIPSCTHNWEDCLQCMFALCRETDHSQVFDKKIIRFLLYVGMGNWGCWHNAFLSLAQRGKRKDGWGRVCV